MSLLGFCFEVPFKRTFLVVPKAALWSERNLGETVPVRERHPSLHHIKTQGGRGLAPKRPRRSEPPVNRELLWFCIATTWPKSSHPRQRTRQIPNPDRGSHTRWVSGTHRSQGWGASWVTTSRPGAILPTGVSLTTHNTDQAEHRDKQMTGSNRDKQGTDGAVTGCLNKSHPQRYRNEPKLNLWWINKQQSLIIARKQEFGHFCVPTMFMFVCRQPIRRSCFGLDLS